MNSNRGAGKQHVFALLALAFALACAREAAAQYHFTSITAGPNGTISPTTVADGATGGCTQQFTFTPNTGYQVYQIRVNGSLLADPTTGRRPTSYTFSATSPGGNTGDLSISVTFEPLYTLNVYLAGPSDRLGVNDCYRHAGDVTPYVQQAAGSGTYYWGDTINFTATRNPDFKFGTTIAPENADGQVYTAAGQQWGWLVHCSKSASFWAGTGRPDGFPHADHNPWGDTLTVRGNVAVRAWYVRANEIVWLREPSSSVQADPYDNPKKKPWAIGHGPFGPFGFAAQLLYEDGEGVDNPATNMILDIARGTGVPGARLYSDVGIGWSSSTAYKSRSVTPRSTGTSLPDPDGLDIPWGGSAFQAMQIDKCGSGYRLQVRYPLVSAGNWNDFMDAGGDLAIKSPNSAEFNITPSGSVAMSWGYNYFGQVGHFPKLNNPFAAGLGYELITNDGDPVESSKTLGDPYDSISNLWRGFPSKYSTAWPHFTYATDFHQPLGWSEGTGAGQLGASDSTWWDRQWKYPTNYHTQGYDFLRPVQPHGQLAHAHSSESYQKVTQAVAAGQYHSFSLLACGVLRAWGSNAYGQLGVGTKYNGARSEIGQIVNVPFFNVGTSADNPAGNMWRGTCVAVAAGMSHTLAIREDGTVWAWGLNSYGQLGDNTTSQRDTPVQVLDPNDPSGYLQNVVAVSAGDHHSLALKKDGSLYAWGYNAEGQVGDNTTTHRRVPTLVWTNVGVAPLWHNSFAADFQVNAVAFSPTQANYLVTGGTDGLARLWNTDTRALVRTFNDSANAGAGAHTAAVNSVAFSPDGKWLFTASIDKTIKVWRVSDGQLMWTMSRQTAPSSTSESNYAAKLSDYTNRHTAAINSIATVADGTDVLVLSGSVDTTVKLWRYSPATVTSQMVWRATDHTRSVNAVAFVDAATAVTASADGTLKLRAVDSGEVRRVYQDTTASGPGAGLAHDGSILSVAVTPDNSQMQIISGGSDWKARVWNVGEEDVARVLEGDYLDFSHRGSVTAVGVSQDGKYFLTGSVDKQLKLWNVADGSWVRTLEGHSDVIKAVAWCPVDGSQSVFCSGSVDNSAKLWVSTPPIVRIDAGSYHNLALRSDGTVLAWGLNIRGQLGLGNTTDKHTPTVVAAAANAVAISAGHAHSLAIVHATAPTYPDSFQSPSGTILAWGYNEYGELGDNTTTQRSSPVTVQRITDGAPLPNVYAVSAGWGFSLARTSAGWFAWGHNHHGQLGIDCAAYSGSTADRYRAVQLSEPPGVGAVWEGNAPQSTISAGYWHSLAAIGGGRYSFTASVDPSGGEGGYVAKGDAPASGVADQAVWTVYPDGGLRVVDDRGARVRFRAVARPGWRFDHWSGNFVGTATDQYWDFTYPDPMSGAFAATAHFVRVPRQFELRILTKVNGVETTAGGTVTGAGTYDENSEAPVSATPNAGYEFAGWSGDAEIEGSEDPSQLVRMLAEKMSYDAVDQVHYLEITASFRARTCTLATEVSPAGAGTVTGAGSYDYGTEVQVQATPIPGYSFLRWIGDYTGDETNPVQTIVMDDNKTLTAQFTPDVTGFTLVWKAEGVGTVTVTPEKDLYDSGDIVTLNPNPGVGMKFDGWAGDLTGSADPAIITMDGNKRVTAYFSEENAETFILTLVANPSGGGEVTAPGAVGGSGIYPSGAEVAVTAEPASGYRFYHWGSNMSELANPKTVTMTADTTMTANFVLASGYEAGAALSWGGNDYGQLGNNTTTPRTQAGLIDVLANVKVIAGGRHFGLAADGSGALYTWGLNAYGQLGHGDQTQRLQPALVAGVAGVSAVAAGAYHALILLSDGSVWACGRNLEGQLGIGSYSNQATFQQVTGLDGSDDDSTAIAIAAGEYHSLALTASGKVLSWGYNIFGQLGVGDKAVKNTPQAVLDASGELGGVTAIAAGANHCLALKNDGTVVAWGYNLNGELGNGTTVDGVRAAAVTGLNSVHSIAAGGYHSMALRRVGGVDTLWTWGDNACGQLGNGNQPTDSSVPVEVTGLGSINRIAGGYEHSMALKRDSTVWTWGRGASGQLGDMYQLTRATPVQVLHQGGVALTEVYLIAGGWTHSYAVITPETYTLTTEVDTTVPAAPGAAPGVVTGGDVYVSGATAFLTATPLLGYDFDHWEGDLAGGADDTDPNQEVVMDGNKTLTAFFAPNGDTCTVNITVTPEGEAALADVTFITYPGDADPDTPATSKECAFSPATVRVDLSGVSGFTFLGWDGGVVLTGNPGDPTEGRVVLDGPGVKNLTARFAKVWNLTVNAWDHDAGAALAGVDIEASNGFTYTTPQDVGLADGTALTLTAPLTDGAKTFLWWEVGGVKQAPAGALGNEVTVTMDDDKTAVAVYGVITTFQVNSSPITSVPIDSATGHDGVTNYTIDLYSGESVNLLAPETVVNGGVQYVFKEWSNGSQTREITLNLASNITAIYEASTWNLNVDSAPIAGVEINSVGTHQGTTPYTHLALTDNTAVSLVAPSEWTSGGVVYSFVRWTKNGVAQTDGVTTVAFNIKQDTEVVAVYQVKQWTLDVQSSPVAGAEIGGVFTNYTTFVGDNTGVLLNAPTSFMVGDNRYRFNRWMKDGALQGEGINTLSFTMKASHVVIAVYTLDTQSDDTTPPVVSGHIPAKSSSQVPLNTLLSVTVSDAGKGVDLASVLIRAKLRDEVVYSVLYDGSAETNGEYDSATLHPAQTIKGLVRRTGNLSSYTFQFEPSTRFGYQKTIDVVVNAADLDINPGANAVEDSWWFATAALAFGQNGLASSTSSNCANPAMARDSNGDVWVVWDADATSGYRQIFMARRRAGDTAFQAPVIVHQMPQNRRNPSIAISGTNIHVAFEGDSGTTANGYDIYAVKTTAAAPTVWQGGFVPVHATQTGDQINPAIAAAPNGTLWLAWEDVRTGQSDIHVASSATGVNWGADTNITNNPFHQTHPAIAVSAANVAYVVWTDHRNVLAGVHGTDIYGAASPGWANVAVVSEASAQSLPAIAAESAGAILHLLWVDDRRGHLDIFHGATAGGLTAIVTNEDNSIIDDDTGADQTRPAIAVAGSTGNGLRVMAAWEDYRNGDADIYYAQTGSGFGVNILVNSDTGTAAQTYPAMTTDGDGVPLLAWVDRRNGSAQIYSSGATAAGAATLVEGLDNTTGLSVAATQDSPGLIVPAGAAPMDVTIEAAPIVNPPPLPEGGFGVPYEFSPAGLQFSSAVTITIPIPTAQLPARQPYRVYWYDQSTGTWSQEGITNVTVVPLSGTLSGIRFQTTHFTIFGLGGVIPSATGGGTTGGGGGGGGGCSMAPAAGCGDVALLALPYLAAAFLVARRRKRRGRG